VVAGDSTVKIVDFSTPTPPSEVGSVEITGAAKGVTVSAGHIYVATHVHGLRILDASDPSAPVEVGSFTLSGLALEDVQVSGTTAYLAASFHDGLIEVDISDPANPTLLASWDTPGTAWGIDVVGSRVYVADGDAGVETIIPCRLDLFSDGFESGDLMGWTDSMP